MGYRTLAARHWQLLVAIGAAWFVLEHLHPELIVTNTTPTGGDTGLHVWAPDALRDVLSEGRTSGWSNDWFAGFPAFRFYMVAPAALVLALDTLMPQNVAFKVVAAAGPTLLPLAMYGFARALQWRDPAPALAAVATLPFLFDRYHQIWGGNIAADLAGEVGYSLSLVAGLGALSGVAVGLRTGGWQARTAGLIALAVLLHPIAALLVVAVWPALILADADPRRAIRWSLAPAGLAAAATSFWVVPFVVDRSLAVDLGWERIDDVWGTMTRLDAGSLALRWEVGAAVVGLIAAGTRRHRTELAVGASAATIALAVALAPESRLWNARLIPLWYLLLHLLAALGAVAVIRGLVRGEPIVRRASGQWSAPQAATAAGAATVAVVAATLVSTSLAVVLIGVCIAVLVVEVRCAFGSVAPNASLVGAAVAAIGVVLLAVSLPLRSLPGGSTDADGTYRWGPFATADQSFVPLWAAWNMEGYEAKNGDSTGGGWSEYDALVSAMTDLGASRGCGRAMWEAGRELERYGTPAALALLPHWTDGCISSMEGLFFESSASSPYHFVNQVELSSKPLPALAGIDYRGFDITSGVDHLVSWGVRYYLAFDDRTVAAARADDRLTEVASSPPWVVFELPTFDLVAPLGIEPVVVVDVDRATGWRDAALLSYTGAIDPRVPLVDDGPDHWTRVPADALEVGVGAPRLEPVTVSDIRIDRDRINFRVDQVGVPVVVRVSWFPAWQVSGAAGPYRLAPNLMVVVPTEPVVELKFGHRPYDRPTQLVSLAAVVGMAVVGRRRTITGAEWVR